MRAKAILNYKHQAFLEAPKHCLIAGGYPVQTAGSLFLILSALSETVFLFEFGTSVDLVVFGHFVQMSSACFHWPRQQVDQEFQALGILIPDSFAPIWVWLKMMKHSFFP